MIILIIKLYIKHNNDKYKKKMQTWPHLITFVQKKSFIPH